MIKLYLATLNSGWLRREFASRVLPMLKATEGVELLWENPSKTWDHPISSNRNQIVKRFLATNCDFLMMIDDDVVPTVNPAIFCHANKDIIGFPAKVRQRVRSLNWVAYVRNPNLGEGIAGYAPVDFGRVDTDIDLLKVDAVGTGCILIHRRVLENLSAPFHCVYDDDGVCRLGTDFAFSKKASEAGFEIYVAPWAICEHFKEVGLADIMSWDDSDHRDELPQEYNLEMTGFEITQGDWRFIKYIIKEKDIKNVLEFGAGLSSILMAQLINVTSYETDQHHIDILKGMVKNGNPDIRYWGGDKISCVMSEKYDLCFVDGPAGKGVGGPGRENSIQLAAKLSDRIIVHDAGRDDEFQYQMKYLKPNFKLIAKSGHHETRCQYWERRNENNS